MIAIIKYLKTLDWQLILPPLLGAIIGYVTNALAVKMLFKPYKKYKVGKIKVPFTPGIIPKQREKISQGIGQVVSEKLLNAETLKRGIKTKAMQNAIVLWLKGRIEKFLKYPINTIGELLKKLFKKDFDHYYELIFSKIAKLITNILKNPKNREIIDTLLDRFLDAFLDRSVDEVIGTDIIQSSIAKITSNTLKKADLQDKIFVIVEDFFGQIFKADKKISEVIPDSLKKVLANYIKTRLPSLLTNLSSWMEDPRVKDVIEIKIQGVLTDYINSLNFLQSVVVGLLGVEEKIADRIPYFIDRLGNEISGLSEDENFMGYLEDKVDLFIDNFMDKKLSTLDAEDGIPLKKLLLFFKEIFQDLIEDPERIKSFLKEVSSGFSLEKKKLASFINEEEKSEIKKRILNTAFSYIVSEKGIENLVSFIKSRIDNFIFNKEIGSIENVFKLKKSTTLKLSKRGMRYIMYFIDREIPVILTSLDLEKLVRERIDSFPLEEVEDLILKIIKDQLKWINVFGAILGCMIGLIQLILR